MKKLFALLAFLVLFFGVVSVKAEETVVDPLAKIDYAPRLLPTSPFYFLKSWKEKLELLLARKTERKVVKRLEFANRRLAELKGVAKKQPELVNKLADRYEEQLFLLEKEAQKLKEQDKESLMEHVGEVMLKHQEILLEVLEKAPEAAKKGLENALEKSRKGHERAVKAVSK